MSGEIVESKRAPEAAAPNAPPQDNKSSTDVPHAEKPDVIHADILGNGEVMLDAYDGENREHEMTLWQSAKSHPWACFWAFTMCFTIVSPSLCSLLIYCGIEC